MAAMKPHGARIARYIVSLAEDGAFLIYDRKKLHKRTARFLPAQFVSGQGDLLPQSRNPAIVVLRRLVERHCARNGRQSNRPASMRPQSLATMGNACTLAFPSESLLALADTQRLTTNCPPKKFEN